MKTQERYKVVDRREKDSLECINEKNVSNIAYSYKVIDSTYTAFGSVVCLVSTLEQAIEIATAMNFYSQILTLLNEN